MCFNLWYNAPTMLAATATSWVHYTTSCNTQSSAPEDGRSTRNCPKHVELIGIINKPLLLHVFGVYIIYINDERSSKYQIYLFQSCFDLFIFTCELFRIL